MEHLVAPLPRRLRPGHARRRRELHRPARRPPCAPCSSGSSCAASAARTATSCSTCRARRCPIPRRRRRRASCRPGTRRCSSMPAAPACCPRSYRPRLFSIRNPHSVPTFLVDGAVAGAWRFEDGGDPARAVGAARPRRRAGAARGGRPARRLPRLSRPPLSAAGATPCRSPPGATPASSCWSRSRPRRRRRPRCRRAAPPRAGCCSARALSAFVYGPSPASATVSTLVSRPFMTVARTWMAENGVTSAGPVAARSPGPQAAARCGRSLASACGVPSGRSAEFGLYVRGGCVS